jgi:hypothetical protein
MLDNGFLEKTAECVLEPQAYVRDLEEFCENRNNYTRTHEKKQSESTPYNTVDLAVDAFDRL